MKVSEAWLRSWVTVGLSREALAEQLTMAGLEVGAIEPVASPPQGVVVGEVLDVSPHPNADRLRVCVVDDGRERHQVVCGAANVRSGLKAPFARVGARLGDGRVIAEAELRGVSSHGMLMSASELGLEDSIDGLLELPQEATPGADIAALLELQDASFDIELTPNRGDCLGVRGLAREISVLNDVPLEQPTIEPVPATIEDAWQVRLEAPAACPRYLGRIIRGVDVKRPTPLWMRERLRRSGLRSIDPVVDVTNYVLLELGQPMHAFDLAQIDGGIVVRMANPSESLELLDGSEIELAGDTLVIADAAGPVAMAGVMGGRRSAIATGEHATRDVFLECAFFSPLAINGRQRQYGVQTDAAHRYERGVDFELQRDAVERATRLLLEVVGGEAGPIVEAVEPEHLPKRPAITLRAARIRHVLGFDVPEARVEAILGRLEMRASKRSDDSGGTVWEVVPPSHRFDIEREIDLIEEVARIHGYERIPMQTPVAALALAASPETRLEPDEIRAQLSARGYHEAITYSFIDPKALGRFDPERPRALANPMSADQSVMRTSLWPGLVAAATQNLNRQHARVRLFEVGRCFTADGEQPLRVGGISAGDAEPESWYVERRALDFFDLKGDVEALLTGAGEVRFERSRHPALHPGQSADVLVDGRTIGRLGRVHPAIQAELGVDAPLLVFELDAEAVCRRRLASYEGLSRFPSVRRDVAVVVDVGIAASEVLDCARSAAGQWLKDLTLFDVYAGKGIDSNKKSLALGLTFQHPSRTLTDAEVNAAIDQVVAELGKSLGAARR